MQQYTLSQAVGIWLALHIPTTQASYTPVIKDLLRHIDPDTPLTAVTPAMLAAYMAAVASRETIRSGATINKYVKTLRVFFNWCLNMEYIESSPARVLKRRKTSDYVQPNKAMSETHLNILLAHCRRRVEHGTHTTAGTVKWISRYRDLALVLFLTDTGCRIRGAAGLTAGDLDLEQMTAVVTEKGNKTRTVWFESECAAALRSYLHARSDYLKARGGCLRDVFIFSTDGAAMTTPSLGQCFKRACVGAGLGFRGPHSLRHRKGHQLQRIVDPVTASMVLGHSSPDITMKHYYKKDTSYAEYIARQLAVKPQQQPQSPDSSKIIPFPKIKLG